MALSVSAENLIRKDLAFFDIVVSFVVDCGFVVEVEPCLEPHCDRKQRAGGVQPSPESIAMV